MIVPKFLDKDININLPMIVNKNSPMCKQIQTRQKVRWRVNTVTIANLSNVNFLIQQILVSMQQLNLLLYLLSKWPMLEWWASCINKSRNFTLRSTGFGEKQSWGKPSNQNIRENGWEATGKKDYSERSFNQIKNE